MQVATRYFILVFMLTGCCPKKCEEEPEHYVHTPHRIYRIVPRHKRCIPKGDLLRASAWALFGNDDDGLFGEDQSEPFEPEKPATAGKALRWWLRNPLHNFTFYVIGSADRVNNELTLLNLSQDRFELLTYRPCRGRVFGSRRSSLFFALHGWKPYFSFRLLLPFKKLIQGYIGWRERGNFGLSARFSKQKEKKCNYQLSL